MPSKGIQTARGDGPVKVSVIAAVANIRVHTEPGLSTGRVEISTVHETGPVADAYTAADLHNDNGLLTVIVPGPALVAPGFSVGGAAVGAGRHTTIIGSMVAGNVNFGHGGIFNTGTMINSGGGTFIAGDNYGPGAAGATAAVPGFAPIEITVRVPEGTKVHAEVTAFGNIDTTDATLGSVYARNTSGHIRVGTAADADLATLSGDVHAKTLGQPSRLATTSGDIQVGTAPQITAKTMNGDIVVENLTGPGNSRLQSMSGDIRVGGTAGVAVRAQTMSGDIRYTRHMDVTASTMSGTVRGVDQ
jgi:hypothetical protein